MAGTLLLGVLGSGLATACGPGPVPGAPTVTRTAQVLGNIGIAWSEADGHGLRITGWKVSRNAVDTHGTAAYSTVLSPRAKQFVFQSLQFGRNYDVSVAAVTTAGVGPATTRSVKDDNGYTPVGAPCPVAGATGASFRGYVVCDGFQFIDYMHIAVYNVRAERAPGGLVIRYTADSAPGPAYQGQPLRPATIRTIGSLSQVGAVTRTSSERTDVVGPVDRRRFIAGAFRPGRATLTVSGLSYTYTGLPVHSSEVVGVDVP